MSDSISRQDAIDALIERDPNCGIDGAEIIRELPSAETEITRCERTFQAIIVEYPSISTYPEHEGKPYFSIKYTENGQGFIGYGTYNPEVLSGYLKKYFMPSAERNPYPDNDANDMHERIVNEMAARIVEGKNDQRRSDQITT